MATRRWIIGVTLAAAVVGVLCIGATAAGLVVWALLPRLTPAVGESVAGPPSGSQDADEESLGTDLDGREWTLAELEGRPYVLNFWATWCPPCREELPQMQQLAEEFGPKGVVVLLVNDGETANQARDYLRYHDITLPSIVDPSRELARRYRVQGLPTTVMVGADGEVKARLTGYGGPDYLRRAFERLID